MACVGESLPNGPFVIDNDEAQVLWGFDATAGAEDSGARTILDMQRFLCTAFAAHDLHPRLIWTQCGERHCTSKSAMAGGVSHMYDHGVGPMLLPPSRKHVIQSPHERRKPNCIIGPYLRTKAAKILLRFFEYPNQYNVPGLLHPFKSKTPKVYLNSLNLLFLLTRSSY
jgi:hypothetical protein